MASSLGIYLTVLPLTEDGRKREAVAEKRVGNRPAGRFLSMSTSVAGRKRGGSWKGVLPFGRPWIPTPNAAG
jgi:hypothetical protein